jgi:hypothetical protein
VKFIDLKGKEQHPPLTLSETPLSLGKQHRIDQSYFNETYQLTHLFLLLCSCELSIFILPFKVFLRSEEHDQWSLS